jgi:hypothetical protein
MTELTDRFGGLSRAKRALLEAMLRRPAAFIPRAADGRVPLTWEQRRLWFLHRLAPDAAVYTIPVAYRLRGEIDAAALESALRAIAARHDALRMTFGETEGEPVAATCASRRPGARPTRGATSAPSSRARSTSRAGR